MSETTTETTPDEVKQDAVPAAPAEEVTDEESTGADSEAETDAEGQDSE